MGFTLCPRVFRVSSLFLSILSPGIGGLFSLPRQLAQVLAAHLLAVSPARLFVCAEYALPDVYFSALSSLQDALPPPPPVLTPPPPAEVAAELHGATAGMIRHDSMSKSGSKRLRRKRPGSVHAARRSYTVQVESEDDEEIQSGQPSVTSPSSSERTDEADGSTPGPSHLTLDVSLTVQAVDSVPNSADEIRSRKMSAASSHFGDFNVAGGFFQVRSHQEGMVTTRLEERQRYALVATSDHVLLLQGERLLTTEVTRETEG